MKDKINVSLPVPNVSCSLRRVRGKVVCNTSDGRPTDQKPRILCLWHREPDLSQSHALLQLEAIRPSRFPHDQQITKQEQMTVERWRCGAQRAQLNWGFHDEGARREISAVCCNCATDVKTRPFAETLRFLKRNR